MKTLRYFLLATLFAFSFACNRNANPDVNDLENEEEEQGPGAPFSCFTTEADNEFVCVEGINEEDTDVDGDGELDEFECIDGDEDGDGEADVLDADDDNDGVDDADDNDLDNDGIDDDDDDDLDNDGVERVRERLILPKILPHKKIKESKRRPPSQASR
jgi:hypothetical protein